jgi:NADH dehydrogenase
MMLLLRYDWHDFYGDRRRVPATLRFDERTFVAGDAAEVIDRDGELVPATAQAAIREAQIAASNIARLVTHERDDALFEPRLSSLDFTPRGWIVSVGDSAVAQFGPTVIRGAGARAIKRTVGLRYLSSVGAVREAVEVALEEFGGVR